MTTKVIIPWRQGCPVRTANLNRVITWWETHYPDWPVRIGEYPAECGDWRKSMAIRAAGHVDDSDTVIVSDADVVCEQVELAVNAVSTDRTSTRHYLWAMPHRTVYRLTESATNLAVNGSWWPSMVQTQRELQPFLSRSYAAFPGGGLVVLVGRVLSEIPMDPRFAGWGQEDHSWALALSMMAGGPWRGYAPLWHLWHPPAPRMKPGIGSVYGRQLWHRYRSAATPDAMRVLIHEAGLEIEHLSRCATTSGS